MIIDILRAGFNTVSLYSRDVPENEISCLAMLKVIEKNDDFKLVLNRLFLTPLSL